MYYSDDLVEEVRTKNDIRALSLPQREVPVLFGVAGQADVLLFRMRKWWKCFYIPDGI